MPVLISFVSFDDGVHWQQMQNGLPNSPITDIKIHRKDLTLSTMGRGFWILDNLSVLHQIDEEPAQRDYHLYQPRDAYRMRYRGSSGVPEFIDAGAMVDFYLNEIPEEPLALQFINEEGKAVHSFVGKYESKKDTAKTDEADKEQEVNMKAPGFIPGTAGDLKLKKGHNRFIWNLRYPGEAVPSDDGETYFGVGAGPMTIPGNYTVKLTIGDWSREQPLTIKIDPRVKEAGVTRADMIAQLEHNLKVRDAIGKAQRIAAEIDSARTRLKESEGEDAEGMERLNKLHSELVTSEKGSYPPPMLIDQLEYMYYMTIRADQRPGDDAYTRFNTLKKELDEIAAEWESMEPMKIK